MAIIDEVSESAKLILFQMAKLCVAIVFFVVSTFVIHISVRLFGAATRAMFGATDAVAWQALYRTGVEQWFAAGEPALDTIAAGSCCGAGAIHYADC